MASENAAPQPVVHVIDDDEGLRESLAFLLRSAALEVRSFESAKAFLDVLPHAIPGCIITDVRMPDMSGIEVAQTLRQDPATSHIPIIMLTAKGQERDKEQGRALGAYAYLVKPFSPLELLEKVQAILG